MLVEVLKVKEHSVGAIFFALTNTLEIISLGQCPVGSITCFNESFFISASIMVASVADLLQLGKIVDGVLYQNQFSTPLQ